MKKISILFLILATLLISCVTNQEECKEQKREELQRLERELMMANSRTFLLNSEVITAENGERVIIYSEGLATQRMLDMYNYFLRLAEPQVLFNGRDIVVDDIFEKTLELHSFWEYQYAELNGFLVLAAESFFRRAWFDGYIDHDDVNGCWRGNGDWSEAIDRWFYGMQARRRRFE